MREILFRGKRIDNGVWLYGSLRQYKDGTCGICDRELEHTYRVDPSTIGQYTGLTDKNGKKIFEGDILGLTCTAYPQEKELFSVRYGPYEIAYEDECESDCVVGWYTKGVGRSKSWGEYSLFADAEKADLYYEVIGNIHDNPELINK